MISPRAISATVPWTTSCAEPAGIAAITHPTIIRS
jgi:hypothetical protein